MDTRLQKGNHIQNAKKREMKIIWKKQVDYESRKNDTIYAVREQYIEKNKWKTKHKEIIEVNFYKIHEGIKHS